MAGYLIAETTREEREKIVAESLGNIEANCDGCMQAVMAVWRDWLRCIRNTLMGRKSFARSIWNLTQDT